MVSVHLSSAYGSISCLNAGQRRAGRIAVAEEERAIAEAELLDAVRRLKLEVQQAFIDLQWAQENLALAREHAAGLEEVVTLSQARVRGGDVAEAELLRSRVAAVQSQQAVRAAELKVRTERRRLERVISRTPDAETFEIQALDQPTPISASATDLQDSVRPIPRGCRVQSGPGALQHWAPRRFRTRIVMPSSFNTRTDSA
jgi:outer membrane protein TolC